MFFDFENLSSSMTRLVFIIIENQRLKRARAQHMGYQLKMIFGSGSQFAAYHTFTSK